MPAVPPKPSRAVTARCVACQRRFTPARRDQRYCSAACRQRAHRARAKLDALDRQIEAARRRYWSLIRERAEALAVSESEVLMDEAQTVDEHGNVFMHGEHVGHTTPMKPGWTGWGLEAAGPPWMPPPGDGRRHRARNSSTRRATRQYITANDEVVARREPHPKGGVALLSAVKPLPEGAFATIVADPPWRYDNAGTRGSAQGHYDTLTIEELCGIDVASRAADKSHLYLWTTAAHLPDAFRVMTAWGFEYKTYLVWVKPQMGMGNYFRISTELVLFGVRGGLRANDRSLANYFIASRSEHSAKPVQFRELVQRVSPGPYLELFSRLET